MRFNQVLYDWLEENEAILSKATVCKYGQMIRNYLVPFFYEMSCEELSERHIQEFQASLPKKEDGSPRLSAGSNRIILMILNNTLEYGYQKRYLSHYYHIKPRLPREKSVAQVLSNDHQRQLEAYLSKQTDRYSLAVMLALYSGIRIGELCALKWSDFNFEQGSLFITKSVQRLTVAKPSESAAEASCRTELLISETKSRSSCRMIPLPSFLLELFFSYYKEEKQDYFIFSDSLKKPLEPRTLQYAYKRMFEKLEIPYSNFHCLRHTFATRCISLGWDMKTLSEVLGHAEIKVTMEYYFHSSFEYKKEQMNKLVRLV